ncbi:hypothetical protein GGQ80_002324 [Sphingomonas jinjuensis]|uniref:YobI-like P-loop NTPase domain-containing protein n=1 Tax=Sphingomonas jinjuensis TaxID=535907 RepID=A0A840FCF9_9SPHN|nr:hypothetical protein [Sphingomonas jinjuensis]
MSVARNRSWSIVGLVEFRRKLAGWLIGAAARVGRPAAETGHNSRFVDLAPTDEADAAGVYGAALTDATENPRVMNIALTGPYGSGKSSIIKSFLLRYEHPVLQISLAAFLPETVSGAPKASRQEIERSILQQMLYGADANRLPLSRFKRIQSPGRWSAFVSLFTALGLIACWHLMQSRATVLSGAYFKPLGPTYWFNLLGIVIAGAFIWLVCHRIYVASFGISLKSISLKDIEITPTATTEESILNRHLDEIIYFFQSTRYDLVVIEDLDRFENPDIFVTLREINSLINANSGVRRPVRFLYALRDDMFANTDRTKFFEFIIPVIPIINSSNSIDKVLEQVKRLSIGDRLNQQFLREVSRYLDDLRLIRNIFNEYAIYAANLETGSEGDLDPNKLLAILIYKNVFPSDFEHLHRGRGNLAGVLRRRDEYVTAVEARYAGEISRLEALLDETDRQLPTDLAELRRSYAMAVIERVPDGYTQIGTNQGNMIWLTALSRSDRLDEILASSHAYVRSVNGGQQRVQFTGLEQEVGSGRTLQQRTEEVERKSTASRDATARNIADLRVKLGGVRLARFNETIREGAADLNDLFEPFGEGADLARFLVFEGYLDDTHYQYTSLFHSGRLSPSDNRFLIRIRGYGNPKPDFQIDNPREVIAAMRDDDFGRNYVLNARIVDCLLGNTTTYPGHTARFLDYVASDFPACEEFLETYYARGAAVPTLLAKLGSGWPGFIDAVLGSPASLAHVAQIRPASRTSHR